jgi:hypothetical protein
MFSTKVEWDLYNLNEEKRGYIDLFTASIKALGQ